MDNYNLKPVRKKDNRKTLVWNFLTMVVLLGTCGLAYYFYTIFNNPNSLLNPFPPKPLPTLFLTITPTSTIIPLQATWTPTTTISPVPSRTTAPTWTTPPQNSPKPTDTTAVTLTPTPTPTRTPNQAATATAACKLFHDKNSGTPCP